MINRIAMKTDPTYYDELIAKYFAGETSLAESNELLEWINADNENKKLFNDNRKAWLLMEQSMVKSKVEIDKEWDTISGKISKMETVRPAIELPKASHSTQVRLLYRNIARYAAISMILLTVSALAYVYFATPKKIILAAGNTSLEQTLPDGTIVTLNAGSSIEYPAEFINETRNIELKGEAYFKVAHDANHPFIVSANNASVEVLGTSFNINTGALTGKMTVLLTEGKVAVYLKSNTNEKIHLAPGEMAEIEHKTIKKSAISDANYMSWKTGRIVFDNTSMKQIAETLTQVYRTRITIAPGLENCTVTANFNNQSLAAVLNVLKATLDLQVIEKNNSIEITGKACN